MYPPVWSSVVRSFQILVDFFESFDDDNNNNNNNKRDTSKTELTTSKMTHCPVSTSSTSPPCPRRL